MLKHRSTNEDLDAIIISSGYAERQPGEIDIKVMERADSALHESKRNGHNRVTIAEHKQDVA